VTGAAQISARLAHLTATEPHLDVVGQSEVAARGVSPGDRDCFLGGSWASMDGMGN